MTAYSYTRLATSSGEVLSKSTSVRRSASFLVLFTIVFYLIISLLQTSQNLVEVVEPLEKGKNVCNMKWGRKWFHNFLFHFLGEIEFELEHCGCTRRLKNPAKTPKVLTLNLTTCSIDAFKRGPGQKIVGFSFYGDINSDYRWEQQVTHLNKEWKCIILLKLYCSKKKGYFEGIVGNLELMPKYYPGWVMRLYYDLNKKDPVFKDLCELACQNDYLDICDAKHLPGTPFKDASKVFAMNWRFFPTLDPQVNFS